MCVQQLQILMQYSILSQFGKIVSMDLFFSHCSVFSNFSYLWRSVG